MAGCTGWSVVDPLCQAKQVVGSVGNDVFSSIANHFSNVAGSMITWLWSQLDLATSVDITTKQIKTDLLATGAVAALIAITLFLTQVIMSVLRGHPGGLGRAVRGLGISFIGAAFAIATTQLVLGAVDSLSEGVVRYAVGTDIKGLGAKLVAAAALNAVANPAGVLLLSLILIAAVVVIWVALMIRKMLIIIAAVFAPVAFAGATADFSTAWVRRWIEFTAALILSKLVLVIMFMIGLSVLEGAGQTSSGATQSVTNLAIGTLTLLLAGFAPWIAIRAVHFAGDAFQSVHAQVGMATAGGQAVAAAPQKISSVASMSSGAKFGSSATSAAASSTAATAPAIPTKPKTSLPGDDASGAVLAAPASTPANPKAPAANSGSRSLADV